LLNLKKKNTDNIILFFIYLLPIFFILGNPFTNFFVIFICISLFYFKDFEFRSIKKIIYFLIFFCLIVILSSLNSKYIEFSLIKSSSYLRFIIFMIVFPFILKKLENRFEKIGIIFLIIIFFIIFDSLIQLFYGRDIFGIRNDNLGNYYRLSGPFGDELIVGNFVLYFGIIGFYFLFKKKQFSNTKIILFFLILGLFSFLSGERNTFLSFFIFMFFLFFLSKKKLSVILSSLILILFSIIIFLNSERYNFKYNINNVQQAELIEHKNNYTSKQKSQKTFSSLKNKLNNSIWFYHYRAGLYIFFDNKYLGSGFKTFRFACQDLLKEMNSQKKETIICTSHPHNFYIELLSDTGILGFLYFIICMIILLLNCLKDNFRSYSFEKSVLISLFITFIFPFKPHGSLFSTSTAFIFWILLSILIYEIFIKNIKNAK